MFKNLTAAASAATAKAAVLSEQAAKSAAAYIPAGEECQSCGKSISQTRVITGIGALTPCIRCGIRVCSSCSVKSAEKLPDSMRQSDVKVPSDGMGRLCLRKCHPECVVMWMAQLIEKHDNASRESLHAFLTTGKVSPYMKPVVKDTKARKAGRIFHIAGYAADAVGVSAYYKAIKLAAMGTGVLGVLLQGDVAKLLYPLMECLKEFGVEGPNGVLRLYYLGCSYELQRKLNHNLESHGHSSGNTGVLVEECPQETLDYVGTYSGPAQWLYSARLPEPHSGDEWTRWYLHRIAESQGWSVLYAVTESSTLYDGTSCPAFALVGRCSEGRKEAMLVIRGTQTSVDWTINLAETMYKFSYRGGSRGENVTHGNVHTGMMLGALAILDVFCMRHRIHTLLDDGFDVKVVGHSLGAGTAALLTAELKNGLYRRAVGGDVDAGPAAGSLPRVTAIGFGTPPVADESLADAFSVDDLVISVIHRDDVVPRLSRYNIEKLAKEVNTITPTAERWKAEDQAGFTKYAQTYGQAGDMAAAELSNSPNDSDTVPVELDNPDDYDQAEKMAAVTVEQNDNVVEQTQVLLIPGKIVHLHLSHARYKATLCDHRLAALRSIAPLSHGVDDHKMSNHIAALRSIKMKTSPVLREAPQWQNIYDSDTNRWAKCYVCDSDPTWAFITKSDATRALVYHNCRSCGKVVCSICAPNGDIVPGDGVGTYNTLADNSLALPSIVTVYKVTSRGCQYDCPCCTCTQRGQFPGNNIPDW